MCNGSEKTPKTVTDTFKKLIANDNVDRLIKKTSFIIRLTLKISIFLYAFVLLATIFYLPARQNEMSLASIADKFILLLFLTSFYTVIYFTIPSLILVLIFKLSYKHLLNGREYMSKNERQLLIINFSLIITIATILTIRAILTDKI